MDPLNSLLSLRPRLYFVKVDVQACFDTIEQAKLLGILRELISEVSQCCVFLGMFLTSLTPGCLCDSTLRDGANGRRENPTYLCEESYPRWYIIV